MSKRVFQSFDKFEAADLPSMSIDNLAEEFQAYKQTKSQQSQHGQTQDILNFDKELVDLREELTNMRSSLERLKSGAVEQCGETKRHATDKENAGGDNKSTEASGKLLRLTCKSTVCLFENCTRRVDSQLMLIHFLSDHSGACGFRNYYEVAEGERIVLSFDPKLCHFRKNKVLGLLAFSGTLENKVLKTKQTVIYNSFLPAQYEHLESHKPIAIMLCKTSASAALKDKLLAKRVSKREKLADQIYVIWLVSPNTDTQMNATLSLCGRDPINALGTIITIRHMSHTQKTQKFMPIDQDYWRLTHAEVVKLTNDFRDQLHLEISLTEC